MSPRSSSSRCNQRPSRWLLCIAALLLALSSACERDEEEAPEEVEPVGTGRLEVRALYSYNGPEADGVRFTVEREGERAEGPTRRSGFDLEAGTYEVIASLGQAQGSAEAEIRADERTDLDVVLDAGVLELSALLAEEGPEAPGPRYRILSSETDIRGEHETIDGPTRRTSFVLPAGSYLAQAQDGQAEVQEEIEIEAGERTETAIILDAGIVAAEAEEADGSEVAETVRWQLLSVEEDIRGERETIVGPTRSDQFVLPSGEYLLQARVGDRVAQEKIEVEAGARIETKITLPDAEEAVGQD